MQPDDLDRSLADDEAIVPSSGFAASVMDAVTREALEPPAIPFPWTRALPGLASLGVALVAAVASAVLFGVWQADAALRPTVERVVSTGGDVGWVAAAVMLTVASLAWCWRLVRG
jgi:hypothetical protein